MNIRILTLFCCMSFSLMASAQASGGQIRRNEAKPKIGVRKSAPSRNYNSMSNTPQVMEKKGSYDDGEEKRNKTKDELIKELMENMVFVKGGYFNKRVIISDPGEPNEQITKIASYYISKYEVTQEQWELIMGYNNSFYPSSNHPVENVDWNECQEFVGKLCKITAKTIRLPTEDEWEYAAMGGRKRGDFIYAGSNNIDDVAIYSKNSYELGEKDSNYGPQNVGSKHPNELGLYDMCGNVAEWCSNLYMTPAPNARATVRGGGWIDSEEVCRISFGTSVKPDTHWGYIGLRIVMEE